MSGRTSSEWRRSAGLYAIEAQVVTYPHLGTNVYVQCPIVIEYSGHHGYQAKAFSDYLLDERAT